MRDSQIEDLWWAWIDSEARDIPDGNLAHAAFCAGVRAAERVQPRPKICTCTHLELGHELNAKGVRTYCQVYSGPRGARCPCKRFGEAGVS